MSDPSTIFYRVVRGSNFMTPTLLRFYEYGDEGAIELSEGTGLRREPIFGVTVVEDGKQNHEDSCVFHSEASAIEYIHEMQDNNG